MPPWRRADSPMWEGPLCPDADLVGRDSVEPRASNEVSSARRSLALPLPSYAHQNVQRFADVSRNIELTRQRVIVDLGLAAPVRIGPKLERIADRPDVVRPLDHG